MTILIYIYLFILGLVFGSFFNVVGLRVPNKQSIINPPSHCPQCQHRLGVWDLIPVFSYLFNRGKCRYCGEKVSPIYMTGELCTGVLFVWVFAITGYKGELIIGLLVVCLSVIITVSDLKYMIIPNNVLLFFLPFFIITRFLFPSLPIWHYVVGFFVGGGILLLLAIVSRGGMGMGDVKLFAIYGFVLGYQQILFALFIASVIGSLVGISLILFKKVQRKQPIPFGPYLALGTLITYGYGDEILQWYRSFLLHL
ncbi:prepilin peptidase [Chengkuizengella axinellae]|uniref:Prepilin peptidase n=1 Tax=Chengkuizengella axinellae TaxID=3064388 RepID=A0ABT9IYJ7_9BACL|nr:A24 family peptidase [Chengkuizengella sp. 2205SS18-9]MDP5274303.1 prepilin peptidase [Chengkuizengella sp. 2205SS18-9]